MVNDCIAADVLPLTYALNYQIKSNLFCHKFSTQYNNEFALRSAGQTGDNFALMSKTWNSYFLYLDFICLIFVLSSSSIYVMMLICFYFVRTFSSNSELTCLITSPAGAVAKSCDEHVCVCVSVCLSVCPRGYSRNRTRDLYQIFVHIAYGRGSVFLR